MALQSMKEDHVVYAGFLWKKGASVLKKWCWKLRYIELHFSGLFISRKREELSKSAKVLMRVSYDSVVVANSSGPGGVVFGVEPCGFEDPVEFKAHSEVDAEKWVAALRKVQVDSFTRTRLLPDKFPVHSRGEGGGGKRGDCDDLGVDDGNGSASSGAANDPEPEPETGESIQLDMVGPKPRNISPMPGTIMGTTGSYKSEFGKVVGYVVEDRGTKWLPVSQRDIRVPKKVMKACIGTVQGDTGWYEGGYGNGPLFYSYDPIAGWTQHPNPTEGPIQACRGTVPGHEGWYLNGSGHELYCKYEKGDGWMPPPVEDVFRASSGLFKAWYCRRCNHSNDGSLVVCEACFAQEDLQCKLCCSTLVNTVFLPCGHETCCKCCAWRLRECPFCRSRIDRFVLTHPPLKLPWGEGGGGGGGAGGGQRKAPGGRKGQ